MDLFTYYVYKFKILNFDLNMSINVFKNRSWDRHMILNGIQNFKTFITKGNMRIICLVKHSVRDVYFYLSLIISYSYIQVLKNKL